MKFLKLFIELSMIKVLVFGLVLTGVYYASFFDDGKTIQDQIISVEASIVQETKRRSEIEKTMKKEEEMRGNILQLTRNLEHVKAKIPSEFNEMQMSTIINSITIASKIKLIEFSSEPSSNKPSIVNNNSLPTADTVSGDLTLVKPEDLIDQIRFKVTLKGQFEDFLLFLDNLSKEEKIIRIRNFTMEKNSVDIDDDSIKLIGEVVGYKQSSALRSKEVK